MPSFTLLGLTPLSMKAPAHEQSLLSFYSIPGFSGSIPSLSRVLVLGLEWTGGRRLCDTAMVMGLGEEAAGIRDSSC